MDEAVHPRPALLRVAGVEVEQVEPERRSVGVVHLEDPHVGVVADEVVALGEGQAVEQLGRTEDAVLQDPLGLEVGPHLGEVHRIPRGAHALGPEGPVVGLDRVSCLRLEQRPLRLDVARGCGREPVEQSQDALRRPGRRVGERRARVRGVAEEAGPLRAQPDDLQDERLGVVGVAAVAPGALRVVQAAAQVAVRQRREVRVAGGQDEREQPRAVVALLARGLCGGGDLTGGEAVELGDVVDEDGEVVGVGEQLLLEVRAQGRELLVELTQPHLVVLVEPGAGDRHLGEVTLDQATRLGVQRRERVLVVMDRLDPSVEAWVEAHGVAVGRELRGVVLLDRLHRGGRERARRPEEGETRAAQQRSGALQRDEGVLEGRGLGVGGDGLDLGAVLRHAEVEGLPVVLVADQREGRQGEGQRARLEQRVGRGVITHAPNPTQR